MPVAYILMLRGWRGQAPRQPGQIRKEAAVTSPAWVVVQPLTQYSLKKEDDDGHCIAPPGRRLIRPPPELSLRVKRQTDFYPGIIY